MKAQSPEHLEMIQLLQEFFRLMEIQEESDSGRVFYPNQITSCRALDLQKIDDILTQLKKLSHE